MESEVVDQLDSNEADDNQYLSNDNGSETLPLSGHPYNLRERQNMSANICHEKVLLQNENFTCHKTSSEDPDTPTLTKDLQSSQSELWMEAIAEEFESLLEAETWDVVQPPVGLRIFPSKFVLKVKRNSNGSIERYKARLVLLGHLQRPDIDFFETYAPVVDFTAVRIALAIASHGHSSS
jgi:Reverse transcriptase (RNA-dependent DNA polymerase)